MRYRMAPEVEWRRKNSTDDGSEAHPVRNRGNIPDLLQDVGSNEFRTEDHQNDGKGEATEGGRIQGGGGGGKEKRGAKQPADTTEAESSAFRENDVTSGDNSCNVESPRNRKDGRRLETLKRVLCCFGWLFCCPCWTLGFCLREQPESMEELRGDPCWPCDENTPSTLRD